MKGLILIDGNSLGMRANAGAKLGIGEIQTQAVYNALKMLRGIILHYDGWKPVVFWDGRSWRYDVYPEYKGDRDKDPAKKAERDAYKAQRPHILKGLHLLGISQRRAVNLEADDLIAVSVHAAAGRVPLRILSSDQDLMQLIGPNIIFHRFVPAPQGQSRTDTIVEKNFAEYTGYPTVRTFVQGKAMIGGEDNLDGVDGIGKAGAQTILNTFPDVETMLEHISNGGEVPKGLGRYRKKLLAFADFGSEGRAIFERNMRLMLLDPRLFPEHEILKTDPVVNRPAFEDFCEQMAFVSYLRTMDEFIRPWVDTNYNFSKQKAA